MAVDTSIYGLSGRGVKSVNDYDTEYEQLLGLKQNRALGQMKMDEYQRGVKAAEEERAAYAQLMGQAGGDQTRAAQLLMGSTNPNLYAKGAAIQKAMLDAEDKRSEIAKRGSDAKKNDTETRIKAHEFYIQQLGPVADMDGAQRWLNGAVTAGVMSMQDAQAGMAALQKMGPQGLGEWKSKALQGGMSALEQIRAAREAGAAADTRANQTLVPDGKGGYIPNEPLIAAKAAIARAGASNISMGLGSPVTVTGPGGEPMLVQPPTKAGGRAQVVTIDGMPVKPTSGEKMTEDQGKATGWLVQASNAFSNMQKAMAADPDVARPGVADAVAVLPGLGAAGNALRSADRQKFVQGSESLSEALLRAATGAGVNKDEAAQKIRELTPVWGEKPETTRQKMAAIPLYIETLKVRAGQQGARQAGTVIQQTVAPPASGFRYLGKE